MDIASAIDVAVVGTLNMDVIIRVDRMPDVGETVIGRSRSERPGGKGANQALAAATVTHTALIGAVGEDDAGLRLVAGQDEGGVDIAHVQRLNGPSGQAIIEVDESGDNRIIVLSGANAMLTADSVTRGLEAIHPKIVLTQLESPQEVTRAAASWAGDRGRRFILNPSPVADLDDEILAAADPLVVNAGEAAHYARLDTDDPTALARRLLDVSRSVVITLGAEGVVVADNGEIHRIEVDRVRVVDTTGAGDQFAGILAGHLARGVPVLDAAERAAAAATEFVARPRL
ncbi:ribokinase [Gordonia insulae]|uniref:Ribokinase n=1 Tax=Gordonia insulae TaxID=2420509 RepID=A0A3G8JNL0_9ACTN|nr:ribokinase [Gordonia insulae]AZG46538.1 Ribokinase [Gordonia insulae]